jgi:predicted XRE-type DNA-binding protein
MLDQYGQMEELPQPDPDAIPDAKLALGEGIRARLRELYASQQAAAQALGMSQPNLAPLFTGKMDRYSLAWLIMTASRVGLNVLIEVRLGDKRLCA